MLTSDIYLPTHVLKQLYLVHLMKKIIIVGTFGRFLFQSFFNEKCMFLKVFVSIYWLPEYFIFFLSEILKCTLMLFNEYQKILKENAITHKLNLNR